MSIIADSDGNFKAFPPVTRIPIFSIIEMPKHLWHILEPIAISLCCPNALNVHLGRLAKHRLDNALVSRLHTARIHRKSFERILFLGDATSTRGRSFIASETGVIMMVMAMDYTGDQNPDIPLFDYHYLVGHPSNVKKITESELTQLKSHIHYNDLLMWVFDTQVAGENTWRYLFDGSILKNIPFFFPLSPPSSAASASWCSFLTSGFSTTLATCHGSWKPLPISLPSQSGWDHKKLASTLKTRRTTTQMPPKNCSQYAKRILFAILSLLGSKVRPFATFGMEKLRSPYVF
jgi:hypothetical protein